MRSYYRRFWGRFLKDATPWARDNILWSFVAVVLPLLITRLRHPQAAIDWETIKSAGALYAVALTLYIIVQMVRIPKKLDLDRDEQEKSLREEISALQQTITKMESAPPRSLAEQHHYDVAKSFFTKFGPSFVKALRHLKKHGRVTFGLYNPTLIAGMRADDLLRIYNTCLDPGLVTRVGNPLLGEQAFEIGTTMIRALDDLLYDPGIFPME